jgi:hypothetical protein
LPVRDTRIAKKAGSRKKRSSDLVTARSSMLEMYPYAVKRAVSTATKATYRLVDVPLTPGRLTSPIHGWFIGFRPTLGYLGFDA